MLELFLVMVAVASPIFIVVFIIQYFKYRTETRLQIAELKKELEVKATEDLESEIAKLRERIQVLESIVTDGKYQLLEEFRTVEK